MHKRPHANREKASEAATSKPSHKQASVPDEAFPEFERLRFPRSIEEAFGPYARGPVYAPKEKMPIADKVLIAVGLVGLVGMFAVIAFSY